MKIARQFYRHVITPMNAKTVTAVILGNVILGLGAAGLRVSLMGNEPYTAMNMAISDGLAVGLGTYQLVLNLALLLVQLIWGRKYIGFGTIINMCLLGYIIEFSVSVLTVLTGNLVLSSLVFRLLFMLLSLVVLSFGLAMYQTADLGVSPYDYLALGIHDHTKIPYFFSRVLTDSISVIIILIAVCSHFISWQESHLGVGTVLGAFCLGPFVSRFSVWNHKWIIGKKNTEEK